MCYYAGCPCHTLLSTNLASNISCETASGNWVLITYESWRKSDKEFCSLQSVWTRFDVSWCGWHNSMALFGLSKYKTSNGEFKRLYQSSKSALLLCPPYLEKACLCAKVARMFRWMVNNCFHLCGFWMLFWYFLAAITWEIPLDEQDSKMGDLLTFDITKLPLGG